MSSYDVVISGGGMVGSVAALAAAKNGYSTLLIESQTIRTDLDEHRDLRVSAISAKNYSFFKTLGMNRHFHKERINPYHKMLVWDERSDAQLDIDNSSNKTPLGVLIENKHLILAAQKELAQCNHIKVLDQTQIIHFEQQSRNVRIHLNDDSQIKSKALLACEGRRSSVRDKLEINISEKAYHQHGLVAYLEVDEADNQTAYQVFKKDGPLALLPFGNKLYSIVWTVDEKDVEGMKSCSESDFIQLIEESIGKHLGKVRLLGPRVSFPLSQLYASEYFKQRAILCGDTAHGIHPLAGQGVNLGLEDVQWLFECLSPEALNNPDRLNTVLRKYQRRRLSKVRETSELMSFINFMFKDDSTFKKPLRTLGFNLINNSPLKKWLAQQAGS